MEINKLEIEQKVQDFDLYPNGEIGFVVSINPIKIKFGAWTVEYTDEQAKRDLKIYFHNEKN